MANYNYKKFIINSIIQAMLMWILLTPTTLFAQDAMDIQIAHEYLLKGQKNKALESYQILAKKNENIPNIHDDYLGLLLDLGLYKQAETYVEKLLKSSDKLNYRLDLGIVYQRQGDLTKSEKYFKNTIRQSADDVFKLKSISDYLASKDLTVYAIAAIQQARETSKSPTLFALELANLFRRSGKTNEMVNEYLNFITQTPTNLGYVKNVLQALLTKENELEALETLLYSKIQSAPDNQNYAELIIWVNLQQKNFLGAFVQARAFDKRFRKDNSKTFEIAQIAFNNKSYDAAEKAYQFVTKEYTDINIFLPAKIGLLKTKEARVKEQFPVNLDSVRSLINNYDLFVKSYPDNLNSFEGIENQALLYAYYLDSKEKAIQILTDLIANQKLTSTAIRSKAKLDLGDLYLFKQEPWEATLLYSQVEKSNKDTPLAYEAKLKNAKLYYFIGDFKLAEEHLDILKKATTREIANDALELSLRIKENDTGDTLSTALKEYAAIEMLLYQNKLKEALGRIDVLKKAQGDGDSLKMKNATLLDDIYWLQANLLLKQGEFLKAAQLLQNIYKFYGDDVLSDDAYFLEGEIYEKYLQDKPKAMEFYRSFLTKYPGSVYAFEARKRYRELRGDFTTPTPIN